MPAGLGEVDHERTEYVLRLTAVPAALALTGLLGLTGPGAFLVRTFFSMWFHETGHAAASWLCGFTAFPVFWVTWTSEERSLAMTLLVLGASGLWGWRARVHERWGQLAAAVTLAAVALWWTFGLSVSRARELIVFFGDGGAMLLAVLAISSFYARRATALYTGAVRWGLLVMGAATLTDVLRGWIAAWRDPAELPFGRQEYAGLSDASKLVDVYGWAESALVQRHLALGALCVAAVAVLYARGLLHQRARVADAEAGRPLDDEA